MRQIIGMRAPCSGVFYAWSVQRVQRGKPVRYGHIWGARKTFLLRRGKFTEFPGERRPIAFPGVLDGVRFQFDPRGHEHAKEYWKVIALIPSGRMFLNVPPNCSRIYTKKDLAFPFEYNLPKNQLDPVFWLNSDRLSRTNDSFLKYRDLFILKCNICWQIAALRN